MNREATTEIISSFFNSLVNLVEVTYKIIVVTIRIIIKIIIIPTS